MFYGVGAVPGVTSGAKRRWEDVDLAAATLTIRQTLYRLHGSKKHGRRPQLVFKKPKSRASQRTIALPPAVVEALRDVQREQSEERLGHSTPALTLRIYTHTLAGQHEQAAKAVENLLLG